MVQVESGGNVKSRAKTSSAAGLLQFTDETFLSLVRSNEPELAELSDEEVLAKRTEDSLEAKALQMRMGRVLLNENRAALERDGIEVTDSNLWAMHFLGQGRGVAVLGEADENKKLRDVVPQDVIDANKNIKFKSKKFGAWTVGDFKAWTRSKIGGE